MSVTNFGCPTFGTSISRIDVAIGAEYVKYVADRDGHRWQYFSLLSMWKQEIRRMQYLVWLGIRAALT